MDHVDHNEIEKTRCRRCGYEMDSASVTGGPHQAIQPGMISICMNCGELSIFETARKIRIPTEQEMKELENDVAIQEAIKGLQDFNRLHGNIFQQRARQS